MTEKERFKIETGNAEEVSDEARAEYIAECEADVARPGKFEAEPRYSPLFHARSMLGCGDPHYRGRGEASYLAYTTEKVTEGDKLLFPELRRRRRIKVAESEQGFCYCD